MITIKFGKLSHPICVLPGDTFKLTVEHQVVCCEEITATSTITHWAFIKIEGVGLSYFVGNEKITSVLRARFPDAHFEGDE